jgi:hypothetical protein
METTDNISGMPLTTNTDINHRKATMNKREFFNLITGGYMKSPLADKTKWARVWTEACTVSQKSRAQALVFSTVEDHGKTWCAVRIAKATYLGDLKNRAWVNRSERLMDVVKDILKRQGYEIKILNNGYLWFR